MTYEKNVTKKALITGPDGSYYPLPVHRQAAYLKQDYGEISLPVTEQVADEVISLPMYPELTREQIDYVARAVREAL